MKLLFSALAVAALVSASAAHAQSGRGLEPVPADKARITGSILVEFNSRKERSESSLDVYTISELAAADLMVLNGTVQREPEKNLNYSVRFDVFNPSQPGQLARDVAILRGDMPIDRNGRYLPREGNLRIDVVKGAQSSSRFDGVLKGREVTRWWEVQEQLAKAQKQATKLYSRYVNGKKVTIEVKSAEPLDFQGLTLASGPFSYLPETVVTGVLDYDYELGNWLIDNAGLKFSSIVGERTITDKVSGSIRFTEEDGSANVYGRPVSYTGFYDYSLRWNETAEGGDDAFFDSANQNAAADAYFSNADQSGPGIYGRVYFKDSEDGCKKVKADNQQEKCVGPTRSEITYDLRTVGLNYAQLAAWVKLEQIVLGAFTDE